MWYNANRNVSLQIGSSCCLLLNSEQDIEGEKEEEDENESSCSDLTGQLYCYCGRFFHGWMMECSSCLDLKFLMQEDFLLGEINVTLDCSSIWWTWLPTNHNRRLYTRNKTRDRAQTTSAIRERMSSHSNPWWCVSLCQAWIQHFIHIWFWRLITFTCHQSISYY